MDSCTLGNRRPLRASLLGIPSGIRMRIYDFVFEDSRIRIHFHRRPDDCDCVNCTATDIEASTDSPGVVVPAERIPPRSIDLGSFEDPLKISADNILVKDDLCTLVHGKRSYNLLCDISFVAFDSFRKAERRLVGTSSLHTIFADHFV